MERAKGSAPRFAATLVPAPGVRRIAHLEAFLPECARLVRAIGGGRRIDSVAGWGLKPTSRYARAYAAARGLPYLALEDGFLRSVGLGEEGAPPMSLVVDDLGVYYDATRPSRLETMLQDGGWESEPLLSRARQSMARIVETGLSKTNAAPPLPAGILRPSSRRRVLVIDQTAGDASIAGGLASQASFGTMLAAARRDEQGSEIFVRRHPAVAAGLKKGCLSQDALAGVEIIDAQCRAADILTNVDAVYTVSSLTGFEALLRGLPVRCFGLPFYAGWGITRDELSVARRIRRRTVEEVFAAAYLLYARYVDPLTGEPTQLEQAIERLLEFRDRSDRHAGYAACLGFAPWKHGSARTLLYSPRGEVQFFSRPRKAIAAAETRAGRVIFWAGRETPSLVADLGRSRAPVWRMEDGFIRSKGLGSDFHRAASIVLDDLGIYYDPTRPSRLEAILRDTEFPGELLARAERLGESMVRAGVSKYNLRGDAGSIDSGPDGAFRLLVVGQVENDKSILKGCEDVRTNLSLLEAARRLHPGAYIIYKPHPDVEAGNRLGAAAPQKALAFANSIVGHADIDSCLAAVDGVATMTSLAGLEALLRSKPVWTFGRPFYAGWGLTQDALDFPGRTRRLELNELIAGALILYPLYVDPLTGLPCGPEDLIAFFSRTKAEARNIGRKRVRYLRAIFESFSTRPRGRF